jgi:hypothetical protein
MNKGQRHSDDTKTKLSQSMRDAWRRVQSSNGAPAPSADGQGPPVMDETAVQGWLDALDDTRFQEFLKRYAVPRVNRIRERQSDG